MSWLFSRALEAAYSGANCSDGARSARSSLTATAASALPNGRTKDSCLPSPSGAGTSPNLTGDPGVELLTWFREGSRVRTSARPILSLSELPVRVRVSGSTCGESLAKWDPQTCSWRTHQCSLGGGWEPFSATWPRWGLMRNGECWARTTWAASTSASGCSLWATPIKRDWKDSSGNGHTNGGSQPAGHAAPAGVRLLADGARIGRRPRRTEGAGQQGRSEATIGGDKLADTTGFRHKTERDEEFNVAKNGDEQAVGTGCGHAVCDALWEDFGVIECTDGKLRATKPGLCGMAHGVAHRVDRISAVGDGQVPVVVAAAYQILTQ